MIGSPNSVPEALWIIVSARGKIVADLGNGDPLTQQDAEEGAAFLDNSEPDYLRPHRVVKFVPTPQDV